jgi:hypothetical protein
VLPRLGELVEPARVEGVRAWWRDAELREGQAPRPADPVDDTSEPSELAWPLD